jgi:hypothetical protein
MIARRTAVLLGIAALVLAAPATASTAKLRLVKDLPLTLKGSAFKSTEIVTVTATVNGRKLIRVTHASPAGTFSVAFAGVRFDPCKGNLVITARGRRSGLVRLFVPIRECAAP